MRRQMLLPTVLTGAVICGTFLFTGCANTAVPETINVQNVARNVIRVDSKEQVKVEPDIAEIIYSVYSQASDAQICQTQNGKDLDNVLALLKTQGIEDKNIQTTNFGLSPIYDWEAGKTITGYEMTTDITVSNIGIDKVGGLISQSVDAGINSISSIAYKSSKYDEAYQQALTKAIEAAKVKAGVMAEAGGCKLGKIANIEEYGDNQISRVGYASNRMEEKSTGAADMAVKPGEIEIEANINVEFIIE